MLFTILAFSQDPFSGQTYSVDITATDAQGNKQVLKQVTNIDSYDELKSMFTGSSIVKDFASDIMDDIRANYNENQPYAFAKTVDGKSVEVTINEGNTSAMRKPGIKRVVIGKNGDTDVYDIEEEVIIEMENGESRAFKRGRPRFGHREMSPRIAGVNDRDVAFMGVTVGPFNYKKEGQEHLRGVKVISVVEGEAAFNAGLEKGDVITALGENKTPSPSLFTKAVRDLEPGEEVQVTFYRAGKKMTESTTIGLREGSIHLFGGTPLEIPELEGNFAPTELIFDNLTELIGEERPRLGISIESSENGVSVLSVEKESTGADMGLQTGDLITEFDGKEVETTKELIDLIQKKKIGEEVELKYKRDGKLKKGKADLKGGKDSFLFALPQGGEWQQQLPQNFQFDFDGQMNILEEMLDPERLKDLENRIKQLEQKLKESKNKNSSQFS